MTGIDTGTALLILVVFVLPGFVAVLVRERIYEVRVEEATFDRLLTSVYLSLVVWAVPVVVALIAGAERDDVERFFAGRTSLWLTAAAAIGVLLLLPSARTARCCSSSRCVTAASSQAPTVGGRSSAMGTGRATCSWSRAGRSTTETGSRHQDRILWGYG